MKKRLEQVELQLKGYRESYMGELPEQLESNLRILERLQEHLSESQQNLSDARIRLVALQNEAANARDQSTTVIIGREGQEQETNDLDQMKAQLENLLTRYTERHPDVVRLKARIAESEKQTKLRSETAATDDLNGASHLSEPVPRSAEYLAQHEEISMEIRRLETDLEDTKKQYSLYQSRVENTPKREQQLLSLRRDYQNIQTTYDSLLARKLEAEIAVNMERKQKGEQFRVLDAARLPEKPVKPNMKKLFVFTLAAGLAIGGGIIFLLEYLDNTYKRPEEIETDLNLTVLCTIPEIINKKTRTLRRIEKLCCACFGMLSFALFLGFAVLYLNGVDQTLAVVKKIVNI